VIKKYDKNAMPSPYTKDTSVIHITQDNKTVEGTLVAADLVLDVAVIQAKLPNSSFLGLGSSEATPIGSGVVAIGSPKGFENNVSAGVLSGKHRRVFSHPNAPTYLFTDAQIMPGSSGGPLIEEATGKAIGIISLVLGRGQFGLNAVLPIEYATNFLKGNGLL
jgi:S1-C subfamily serine protease